MLKILIIDDTKTVHSFVKSLCKDLSIQFFSVHNGQEAVDLLEKQRNFDVIFLDWEMPVLNGPQTLTRFNSMQIEIPVVMMTTKNSFSDISSMLALGAREYMMKPFTLEILMEKVNYVLGEEVLNAA